MQPQGKMRKAKDKAKQMKGFILMWKRNQTGQSKVFKTRKAAKEKLHNPLRHKRGVGGNRVKADVSGRAPICSERVEGTTRRAPKAEKERRYSMGGTSGRRDVVFHAKRSTSAKTVGP